MLAFKLLATMCMPAFLIPVSAIRFVVAAAFHPVVVGPPDFSDLAVALTLDVDAILG